jgi:AcrR family transcriptional regulator
MAKRRTLHETRQLLLEAGHDLVREFDQERGESTAGALAHIRASDVAARAGLSKGMVYHLWDDQEAYRHDLLIHVASQMSVTGDIDINLGEELRDALNSRYNVIVEDPNWRLFLEMCAYANDPAVREPLQEGWSDQLNAAIDLLEKSLASAGVALRAGLAAEDAIRMTQAVDTGFRIMGHVDDEAFNRNDLTLGETEGWTLYAITMESLFRSITEPVA